jgi:hypothetical protein
LISAVVKDTRKSLDPNFQEDEDSHHPGVEDGTGVDTKTAATIDGVLEIGQNDFTENKNYPLIEEIIRNNMVITNIKLMKDVFT